MPVNITTPQTKTFYIDDSNQGWVLTPSGSITVANGHGIVNNDAFHDNTITVAGSIVADGMYKCGILSNGPNAALKVETGGSIHGYNGISFYGEGTSVENRGKIIAVNVGIYGNAVGSEITNSGTIDAKYGVYVDNPEIGPGKPVYNSGIITADYGVLAQNSSFELTNKAKGEIHGKVVAVSLGGDSHTDYNNVKNSGLIESGGIAIQGGIGKDLIVNNGTIKGAVVLGAGDDTFDNRGGTMTYTVNGGQGDDTYIFGATAFTIVEGGGNDTIGTAITRTLADFTSIENLQLYGTANINGTGNAQQNYIIGNDGNNILDGGIDNVVDMLVGGEGNDTYILRGGADIVFEGGSAEGKANTNTNTGIDTIISTTDRNLAQYERIENLKITGNADAALTGNELANILTGNSGKNTLDGGLEQGDVIDTLNGGAGDDVYMLRSGHDTVIDSGGIDTITSYTSRSLGGYATIENLTLFGDADINGTGNALANIITGNGFNNILNGGAGKDTLIGGAGKDTYVLGAESDKVIDSAGMDTITSTISRSLAGYATIENLKLLGATNINATGNALANNLTGNSGINILSGGTGNDILVGGAGADKLDGGGNTDTASYAGATAAVIASLAAAGNNTGDAKGDTYISIENLTGSSFSDTLTGNGTTNVLFGGKGADKLTGGGGADVFLYKSVGDMTVSATAQDTIYDFSHTQGDRIGLSGIDANTALSGNQAFIFKGTAAFSGDAGELRFEKKASDTYIYGDVNGDKFTDFVIHLDDAVNLQASDFIL